MLSDAAMLQGCSSTATRILCYAAQLRRYKMSTARARDIGSTLQQAILDITPMKVVPGRAEIAL